MTTRIRKAVGLFLFLALARAAALAQPAITNPVPGSVLSSSATFQWTSGTGVSKYYLAVGSSVGATNIYYQNQNLNLSATVANLPTNGITLYVRLWWLDGAGWHSSDSTYQGTGTSTPTPAIISPKNGSTLSSASATFRWSAGTQVSGYYLAIGSAVGGTNILYQNEGFGLSTTFTNLPVNGMTLYARLWWLDGSGWQFADYTYKAAGISSLVPAMISPTNGSTLPSSSATFQWSGGTGVYKYYLGVGTNVGNTSLYYQNQNLNVSATVTNLPTNGMTLFVRLWWLESNWEFADYTYTAATALAITRQGSNLVLSWPTNDPAYALEYTADISASSWLSNTIPPTVVDGQYTVTNGTANPYIIYRLTK